MADIVYINRAHQTGAEVLYALQQIREGFATLAKLDGLRINSISAGQAVMVANFGVQDNTQAQILSDRLSTVIMWYRGNTIEWLETPEQARTMLADLVDAVTSIAS